MLEFVIDKYNIKTWVDAPCGDFNWQHHVRNFGQVNYTGIDIVPEAILQNSRKHIADLPNARFVNVDLVAARNLPYADLYLVRDVIQHLTLEDGAQLYRNVARSGAKWLLTNMYVWKINGMPCQNRQIRTGGYYHNHPMMPPFNFPAPLFYIRDVNAKRYPLLPSHWGVKVMGLWKLDGQDLIDRGPKKGFHIDLDQAAQIMKRSQHSVVQAGS